MIMMFQEQPISMLIVDDSEDDAYLLYSEMAARGVKGGFRRGERRKPSGRNPQTGEAITIAAATTVKFVPGAALKAGVNNPK